MKKTLKKPIYWITLLVILLVIGWLWSGTSSYPPQIVTLPNGERYEFVSAVWGTGQTQPTFAGRLVAHLPKPIANFITTKFGNRLGIVTPINQPTPLDYNQPRPPEPALHFWFRSLDARGGSLQNNFKFMLADKDGVVGGRGNTHWWSFSRGANKWLEFSLPVVPRRSKTLQLFLFPGDGLFGRLTSPKNELVKTGTVRFENPLFGYFPNKWQPESLPATRIVGDLAVRLTEFSVVSWNSEGAIISTNGKQTRFHPAALGEDQEAVFRLETDSPRGTNEEWVIQPAELSDATGNRVHFDFPYRNLSTDEYSFGPALWPDESAWKLKLTMRRIRGNDPEEIVTFTNVPVPLMGTSNTILLTNLINGVAVVIKQEFVRRQQPYTITNVFERVVAANFVIAKLVDPPEGFTLDYVGTTGGSGWRLYQDNNRTEPDISRIVVVDPIPANATNIDITWRVQKTRTVEFFVKPPEAK